MAPRAFPYRCRSAEDRWGRLEIVAAPSSLDNARLDPSQPRSPPPAIHVDTPVNLPRPHAAGPAPPLPARAGAWALFLDFDGTLVGIAATPDAVAVPPTLRTILSACTDELDGAVAVVSGRPIEALDALLAPLRLPCAGLHGLEVRLPDGTVEHAASEVPDLGDLRVRLDSLAREDARLVVEDKSSSLALHYRRAPERESELCALVTDLAEGYRGYHVLQGKKMIEVRPAQADKGDAVERFLQNPPFAGRRPVFAGNRLGGISVKVGEGESRARWRVPDIGALHDWLSAIAGTRAVD